MKRLTLDQTWTKCLAMWKWIAKEYAKDDSDDDVGTLKNKWRKAHGNDALVHNCYFCEYDSQHEMDDDCDCKKCPAASLVEDFEEFWCQWEEHNCSFDPIAFYAELRRLKRIYEKGKK